MNRPISAVVFLHWRLLSRGRVFGFSELAGLSVIHEQD